MIISITYRGSSDKLTGILLNTESKTYQTFVIKGKDWTNEIHMKKEWYTIRKKGFNIPDDLNFSQMSLGDVKTYLIDIKRLGFTKTMKKINFGIDLDYQLMIED